MKLYEVWDEDDGEDGREHIGTYHERCCQPEDEGEHDAGIREVRDE
ncbi:MAG: hypothetical protein ACYTBJ_24810 [Planctomycetota bacterium]